MRQHLPSLMLRFFKRSTSMTIYLMVKTHNITGLKYLCKTTQKNPFKYKGSGIDWLAHLKRYGTEHTTEIIMMCANQSELHFWGKYYSSLWNVVNGQDDFGNKIWANKIPESGGGGTGSKKGRFCSNTRRQRLAIAGAGRIHSDDTKKKISKANKGKKRPEFSQEWRDKLSMARRGMKRKPLSEAQKTHLSKINSIPVYCIDNDTWYDSAEIAGLALNIKKGRINDCCAGRQKSAGGLKFARKKCGDQS